MHFIGRFRPCSMDRPGRRSNGQHECHNWLTQTLSATSIFSLPFKLRQITQASVTQQLGTARLLSAQKFCIKTAEEHTRDRSQSFARHSCRISWTLLYSKAGLGLRRRVGPTVGYQRRNQRRYESFIKPHPTPERRNYNHKHFCYTITTTNGDNNNHKPNSSRQIQ
ncbi:hypothetical protein PAAG_11904 [Paracoccidioides lutzii Pb01]|uniref:Uncharacterized protein n=1 Tax=Paracoccidioides lutzii (strain ATCC MYA-826 / Pb01) TaxID=502779 RepID=A0A0A2V4Y8_PARBA|nr:hypothetical protein PAAG_11904 [Paracoccidioides lutzii Pb01]KGQ01437.1 hypothetical protein PAAG_11904 [Paracoccidioides lutzii Pb01]